MFLGVGDVSIAYATDFELVFMCSCHVFIKFRMYHRYSFWTKLDRRDRPWNAVRHVRDRETCRYGQGRLHVKESTKTSLALFEG